MQTSVKIGPQSVNIQEFKRLHKSAINKGILVYKDVHVLGYIQAVGQRVPGEVHFPLWITQLNALSVSAENLLTLMI